MSSTPDGLDEVVLTLPLAGDLTYDEAHAALLGLVGLFAGVGYRVGFVRIAAAWTLVSLVVAFGYYRLLAAIAQRRGWDVPDRIDSKAAGTMRREAWYFTTVYLASALLGWGGAGLF